MQSSHTVVAVSDDHEGRISLTRRLAGCDEHSGVPARRSSRSPLNGTRRVICMLARAVGAPGFVIATPVGPVLERLAVAVKAPQRVVLMGAAQAGTRLVAVGERGVIALSDDQGKSWRQATVPRSVGLTAASFVDARNGWAVGHGGVVLASRDAGENWVRQFDGLQAGQLVLKAAKASCDATAQAEAEQMVADGADKPFFDLHFSDAKHGLVVDAYNLAFVTEDGAATWQSISNRLDNPRVRNLYAVRARGDELVSWVRPLCRAASAAWQRRPGCRDPLQRLAAPAGRPLGHQGRLVSLRSELLHPPPRDGTPPSRGPT